MNHLTHLLGYILIGLPCVLVSVIVYREMGFMSVLHAWAVTAIIAVITLLGAYLICQ